MAHSLSLQRSLKPASSATLLLLRTVLLSPSSKSFSADALVPEYSRGEIGCVSGIPDEHLRRKVVIFSPARTASQQGSGKLGKWKINFMSTQKWENPLMGWTSTGDPYAHVGDSALGFDSEESAKAFADNHGWDYVVKKRHTPLLKVRAYADNFKWKGPPKTEEN
ncbi:hypothetical protein IFM89_016659 [Coptis chinensis]|uniref:NADH dehydrogenase [ubiquinone] iron-sulfur protein 4, mitochondrial n=1 Tax=Coptis chinensis TaxID=261450 RepID=A0A835INS2_9MAGN|nr:hypothetical protein IFM89_016659 [Coptis chinensis]